jgi:hypothetical protein
MKKPKSAKTPKPVILKSDTFKMKGQYGKSRTGKQGSIRSGGGKRKSING